MIVIRSKVGKGKINQLAKEIQKLSEENKVLIIDTSYVYELFEHLTNNVDYIRLDNLHNVEKLIKSELNYDIFALNLIVSENEIGYYKNMETQYKTQFLLTVQEHMDSDNEKIIIENI